MSREEFRDYSVDELESLAKATTPTQVSLILDEPTVDFLLALPQHDRPGTDEQVARLARSIEDDVLQTLGKMSVTAERLDDGRLRLLAIRELGYPQGLCATVVFGDEERL